MLETVWALFTGQNAIPILNEFFERWPTPEAGRDADWSEIADLMHCLGLHETRAKSIIQFSGVCLHIDKWNIYKFCFNMFKLYYYRYVLYLCVVY